MIRFAHTDEPEGFNLEVRQKGNGWLAEHSEGRPPDYWNAYKSQLATAFRDLCAYAAHRLNSPGTVDHFVSIDEDRSRAYEWANYRYSAGWVNSSKQTLRSTDILDPFEVQDDWFEMILPSLQVRVTDLCPPELRERANFTLTRLHLRHDERVMRYRRQWLALYERGEAKIDLVERWVPMLARALRRRDSHSTD